MPWNASLDPEFPIVETNYSGLLAPKDLADAFHATLQLSISSGRNLLLGDCTALSGGHSITDLYFLAGTIASDVRLSHLKEAVLFSEERPSSDMVKFWETVCYNRGINVRTFTDRRAARKWLLDGDAS